MQLDVKVVQISRVIKTDLVFSNGSLERSLAKRVARAGIF